MKHGARSGQQLFDCEIALGEQPATPLDRIALTQTAPRFALAGQTSPPLLCSD